MNKDEMIKEVYTLMVKNNPDEAIKTLIMYDKKLNNRFMKNGVFSLEYDKDTLKDLVLQLQDRIDKAIEYIHNNQLVFELSSKEQFRVVYSTR